MMSIVKLEQNTDYKLGQTEINRVGKNMHGINSFKNICFKGLNEKKTELNLYTIFSISTFNGCYLFA